jgi:hypothetical protein
MIYEQIRDHTIFSFGYIYETSIAISTFDNMPDLSLFGNELIRVDPEQQHK